MKGRDEPGELTQSQFLCNCLVPFIKDAFKVPASLRWLGHIVRVPPWGILGKVFGAHTTGRQVGLLRQGTLCICLVLLCCHYNLNVYCQRSKCLRSSACLQLSGFCETDSLKKPFLTLFNDLAYEFGKLIYTCCFSRLKVTTSFLGR